MLKLSKSFGKGPVSLRGPGLVVMSEILPRIAYVTWMNAFLNFSFLMMVGTVIINLVVGALDQQGRSELANRVDRLCRWIFPLTYFGLILFAFGVTFLVF